MLFNREKPRPKRLSTGKIAAITLTALFSLCSFAQAAEPIEAITKPYADIDLSFVRPGRILQVAVQEGDIVKKGKILARQEDEAEKIQLKMLKAKAEDTTKFELSKVELEQKQKDLNKFISAEQEGAVTDWEIEHAKFEVKAAEISERMAIFEHDQDVLKELESKVFFDQLHLYSPIKGIVEDVKVETGESVQALAPVIRVVEIDPLLIEAPVPINLRHQLKSGKEVEVIFAEPMPAKSVTLKGYIENISSVADAASGTIQVKIKVPNPDNRPAGERVQVKL